MSTLKEPATWRVIQRKNFTHLKPLADFLELTLDQRKHLKLPSHFTLNVPFRLAEKMEKKNLNDPLFKQFVPFDLEEKETPGFGTDPIQETLYRSETRFLQKYKGRALLLASSACAMHCRYCFRKNFDYGEIQDFSKELTSLQNDPSLHEVILSGGDPLSLSNASLSELLMALDAIPHLTKIRFHSRFPIGIPERIDEEFLEQLSSLKSQLYFVIHCNHPRELDEDVARALKRLQKLGVNVLNQAVLLKGVNDNYETQLELHQLLIDSGILPYYLHQLDRAKGTAHFEVPREKGRQIITYLRSHLPGYAVPTYVQEIAGEPNKTVL